MLKCFSLFKINIFLLSLISVPNHLVWGSINSNISDYPNMTQA